MLFSRCSELSLSFGIMKQQDRTHAVRCMLLSLVPPRGTVNDLNEGIARLVDGRKKRRRLDCSKARVTTKYVLRGKRLCVNAFSAIVQLNPPTVSELSTVVLTNKEFTISEILHGNRRKGNRTVQSTAVLAFLDRHSDLHALSCPTGRGSVDENPIRWLPIDHSKAFVYDIYSDAWKDIVEAAFHVHTTVTEKPKAPLTKDSFCKGWSQ